MNPGQRVAFTILALTFVVSLVIASSAEPRTARAVEYASSSSAKKLPAKHFVGVVLEVNPSKNAFTISHGGKTIVVVTDSQTKFQSFGGGRKSSASLDAIKKDSRVAAVGDLSGSTLTAKLVALLPSSFAQPAAGSGKVLTLSSSIITYLPVGKSDPKSFNITSSTVFTKKVDGKIQHVKLSDLSVGDRIGFVGVTDSAGTLTAKLVHVIPAKSK